MRFLHLADLHIGKKIGEYPLFDDQRHVLLQAFDLVKEENLDAIIVAGDIYDSSAPSAEAMAFYDWFLSEAHKLGKPILMISGNHDSAERLSVASSILSSSGIHIATKLSDALRPITIQDVNFYLLPFFRISQVNRAFDADAKSYAEAISILLSHLEIDDGKTNVLAAHQAFLPQGESVASSGSETSLDIDSKGYVGGSEVIDVANLCKFDYVALGHIHKAQQVAKNARYAGALLKYHIDEAQAKRSFSIVAVNNKSFTVEEKPIRLLKDLVILEGSLEELLNRTGNEEDYVYCKLKDEEIVDSPMGKLKAKYRYCLGLEYPRRNSGKEETADYDNVEEIDKNDLFESFFETYGGRKLDEKEKEFVKDLFDKREESE